MNRCNLTSKRISDIRDVFQGKRVTAKMRRFLSKFPCQVKGKKVFFEGKQLIAQEDTHAIMKKELLTGEAPFSCEQLFLYLYRKYWGFTRRKVADYVKSLTEFQLMKVRPYVNTRNNKQRVENSTQFMLRKYPNLVGVDLVDVRQWTAYPMMLVVVHKNSNRIYAAPLKKKTAKHTLTKFKPIFRQITKEFGFPEMVTMDSGGEFMGEFDRWLKESDVKTKRLKLVSFVEKANQTLCRQIGILRSKYGWQKSFDLGLKKVNQIKSRITKGVAADLAKKGIKRALHRYGHNLRQNVKQRKQPVYKKGNRVRYLLRNASDKNAMYKSYMSLTQKGKSNWSPNVHSIEKSKKKGYERVYYVDKKWRPSHELQLIKGPVRKLAVFKPKPKPKPVIPKVHVPKVILPVRRSRRLQGKSVEFEKQDPPIRRSRRLRGKTAEYSMRDNIR